MSAFAQFNAGYQSRLTRWLWKLAMTNSAADLSAYASSATTFGLLAMIRQLSICPVEGSRAAWISAAVVPGAKFRAITTNGPEAPLMDRLLRLLRGWGFAFPPSESNAFQTCSALTRSFRPLLPRDRPFDGDGVLAAFPVAEDERCGIKKEREKEFLE